MNTGVELLIKRLKDCPEDFHYDPTTDRSSKWNSLLMEALRSDVITEEEKVALRAEVTEMGRERFTKKVMQTLAGVEDETSEQGKSYTTPSTVTLSGGLTQGGFTLNTNPQGHATWATTTATGTISADSIMLGNTSINEATINQILQAHKEVRQKQTKPKRWWNKSLPELFGRK